MSEPGVSDLLTVAQAIAIIDATPVAPRVVEMPLQEAQGLRLAEDLRADRNYPPFDKSLMDGFAVRCADLARVPAELKVVGEVAAGQSSSRALGAGEAMAIMTGAPIPPGADCVVPVEETTSSGAGVRITGTSKPGRYIAKSGSDAPQGQVVLKAGTRLEAGGLAAAASVGAAMVKVFAAPRVAIFATGDEIVPFDSPPAPSEIRNSNNIMMSSLLRRMGCRVIDLGIIADKPESIRHALLKALAVDAAVISGGMSMGRYDFVPAILKELGAELKIGKLRIKPGKPFIFSSVDRKAVGTRKTEGDPVMIGPVEGVCQVFGLPGNPVSGFVCLLRLASRLFARMSGGMPVERWLNGKLATPLEANGPREFYQPVLLEWSSQDLLVRPLPWKGSADLFTLAAAHGLLVRAENEPAKPAGAEVRVMDI
ncbi:MAG TPA: gephyrin-like molybdotransferase Glp [Tepidisphaeraceae bacterium]|jgi:molybdopterin molybdotransferase|nr:gephyrin-like molybdotransferase Glp [Tepidisphaeraceae bacterium]